MDMLRYDAFTGGAAWAMEYGSSKDTAAFRYLRAYSPLHNVKAGVCYPATLLTTADHDDRVVPSHSYKFAATLQKGRCHAGCEKPVLLRVEAQGSHGYRPLDRRIAELRGHLVVRCVSSRHDGPTDEQRGAIERFVWGQAPTRGSRQRRSVRRRQVARRSGEW